MDKNGNVVIGTIEAVNETDPEQLYYIQNGCKHRVYISRHHGWEYFISRDRAERSARRPIPDVGTIEELDKENPEHKYYIENGCTLRVLNPDGWQYMSSEATAKAMAERAVLRREMSQDPLERKDPRYQNMPDQWWKDQEAALSLLTEAVNFLHEARRKLENAQETAHPTHHNLYWIVDQVRREVIAAAESTPIKRAKKELIDPWRAQAC
jgi:hypothetical protein